jgi:hypothetical protein
MLFLPDPAPLAVESKSFPEQSLLLSLSLFSLYFLLSLFVC